MNTREFLAEVIPQMLDKAVQSICFDEIDYFTIDIDTFGLAGSIGYSRYFSGGAYICVCKWVYSEWTERKLNLTEIIHGAKFGWKTGETTKIDLSDPECEEKIALLIREIFDRNWLDRKPPFGGLTHEYGVYLP